MIPHNLALIGMNFFLQLLFEMLWFTMACFINVVNKLRSDFSKPSWKFNLGFNPQFSSPHFYIGLNQVQVEQSPVLS